MEEKVFYFGDRINYFEPSDDILHNFIFDTCAINDIIKSQESIAKVIELAKLGNNYYITDVEYRELKGIIDRNGKSGIVKEEVQKKNEPVLRFLKEHNFKRVSCIAALLPNFWILDGSFRLFDEASILAPMVNDIHNNNLRHMKDAINAEAAIYNNCILVTSDDRLNKKVNKYFAGRSITTKEFLTKKI